MKRIVVQAATDEFASQSAKRVANQFYTKLKGILDFMDANEEYLDNLLDDPNFYDAVLAETKRLDTVLRAPR